MSDTGSPETRKPAGLPTMAVATFFGLGYSPVASGTAGTVGAIPLFLLMSLLWWPFYALVWVGLLLLSFKVSQSVRDSLGIEDPGIVVIDEVVGYLVAMFLVPVTWHYVLAGFLIFRAFDIVKPFPASYFDQEVKSGVGIVMDDVVAGIYTCLILQAYRIFWG